MVQHTWYEYRTCHARVTLPSTARVFKLLNEWSFVRGFEMFSNLCRRKASLRFELFISNQNPKKFVAVNYSITPFQGFS